MNVEMFVMFFNISGVLGQEWEALPSWGYLCHIYLALLSVKVSKLSEMLYTWHVGITCQVHKFSGRLDILTPIYARYL